MSKRFRKKEIDKRFDLKKDDKYRFGCEFEFYINGDDYEQTIKNIKDDLLEFAMADILVDTLQIPNEKDKNQCFQIKPDISLDDNGIEISTPITTSKGLIYCINNILPLISKYGYTNEDTGLHFHISTQKSDGVNIDFYLFMLICYDKKLLSSWSPRAGYSQNVMDVLSKNTKLKTRKIKTKKGTIWNLEKISPNHIEIKTIGGIDYHKNQEKICDEFEQYANYFDMVCQNTKTLYEKTLIKNHKKQIESIDENTKIDFAKAMSESGLISD